MTMSVAVVGAGYWGPNLARNFRADPGWDLVAVCDLDADRARSVIGARSTVEVETSLARLLARDDLDAVAVATPARTHAAVASAAIAAGKHVLVEKPLADGRIAAQQLVDAADAAGVTLMIDHTFCYTPVVTAIEEMIGDGTLGDVLFIDSVRINLGLVQPDVDVFWDLAPHDLSILDTVLPGGLRPLAVSARGSDPLGTGKACVGYLAMDLPGGASANVHVNWLSPTKVRQMIIGGTRRTVVWDDLSPTQRLSVYDRGVDLVGITDDRRARTAAAVSYRLGDMHAPALPEKEALRGVTAEFHAAITARRPPKTDGWAALRVIEVLEAADRSQHRQGLAVDVALPAFAAEAGR